MQEYERFINRFSKLGKRVDDLSRIGRLMKAVGDPQQRLRFIHVAGTNGKGSCCEMLAKTLTAAGYRTGLFTSPYIIRYNDRIRINGEDITDAELNELALLIEPSVDACGEGFSQFEITQAMGLLHFARQKCDVVVLETGLGGRLDSTNIIPPPEAALITSIALDHTAILGDTIEEIAMQKAGIIKRGSAAVCSACVKDGALTVMQEQAERCGTHLRTPDMSRMNVRRCDMFGSEFDYGDMRGLRLMMGGTHQLYNAAAVIETAEALRERGFSIPEAALRKGLTAQIPARIQMLSRDPLVIVDGGHNPEGISALAATVGTLGCKKHFVIGMLSDKDSAEAARLIAPHGDRFVCVDSFAPNARNAAELAELLKSSGADAEPSTLSAEETVARELASLGEDEALIICGSLYLASLFAGGIEHLGK
ncbi:dihydrofolate synthase / folylpolyglutamate synthase [Ruminococcus sp. YE71]|uniref:bifunctional folylpolyglutamate synthase/dihydrofolate synthase n=1 Tax=unclassified Ruminococcus TaxID=2608920 RepID=UPI0008915CB4|nr:MULTISPECIES: folylpolyglutamate synthase/dihydrofolate synthase family protein [unclassified Ruminococcus]SDA29340.1 dihydrofolate synthase / folylpolyglutamate synthase [Ruminococcus sp. YE78]SFW48059.1 dihydrofolate synthase / folylpolyglutamate synthase [Ruminococcus sp. YE71]